MDAQLLAAELGVVAGVVGAYAHRRGPARAWLPHLIMGGAMAGMVLPERDPLGPGGWMLVLGCAAAWSLGRPGRTRVRAAVALDLYAMGVLTLLMPAVHGGGGHGAAHASGSGGHGAVTGWWSGPYVALLGVWVLCRVVLAATEHRRHAVALTGSDTGCGAGAGSAPGGSGNPSVSSACSAAMIGSMTLMAFAP